jgi:hypothetical protein
MQWSCGGPSSKRPRNTTEAKKAEHGEPRGRGGKCYYLGRYENDYVSNKESPFLLQIHPKIFMGERM